MVKERYSNIWPNQTIVSDQSELTILLCQPMNSLLLMKTTLPWYSSLQLLPSYIYDPCCILYQISQFDFCSQTWWWPHSIGLDMKRSTSVVSKFTFSCSVCNEDWQIFFLLLAMIIYRMVIVEGCCTKLQLLISYIYNHWLTQKYSEFWLVRYNAGYCCYFLLPSYIYDHWLSLRSEN